MKARILQIKSPEKTIYMIQQRYMFLFWRRASYNYETYIRDEFDTLKDALITFPFFNGEYKNSTKNVVYPPEMVKL